MFTHFHSRKHAGEILAKALAAHKTDTNTIILALPRGGVPVGFEVAMALELPLDIVLVRKLGVPWNEEYAFGAIASNGGCLVNDQVVAELGISEAKVKAVIVKETKELQRREALYRGDVPFPNLAGKTIILVDDGIATGSTMKAAILALKQISVDKIIVAVPVGSVSNCHELERVADQVICLKTPTPFYGVGQVYADFSQNSDEEVQKPLEISRRRFL